VTKDYDLTPEETAAFVDLKTQQNQKQQELLAIQGALQGAIVMVTSQKGALTAQAKLNSDCTKLTVTVPDEVPPPQKG
jgi:hypothetical protein